MEHCSTKGCRRSRQTNTAQCGYHYNMGKYGLCVDEFCRNPATGNDKLCYGCRKRIKENIPRKVYALGKNDEQNKWCFACKTLKPRTEYHRAKNEHDGLTRRCKDCRKENSQPTYRKHHLSKEQYDNLLLKQNFQCYVCGRKFSDTLRPNIDHDHNCCDARQSCGGCVRGIICPNCNKIEGYLRSMGADTAREAALKFFLESLDLAVNP